MRFGQVDVIPVGGEGPEDVVVDEGGRIYTGLADGRILRISPAGDRIETIADTGGRPLGCEFYGDDELLVCDARAGLLAVGLTDGAVRTLATEALGLPFVFCNNAAVAADGTIYFTDSSRRFPIDKWRDDLIEQSAGGRLLRRHPDGTIDQLADGLQFANGVALARNGTDGTDEFVAVAETGSSRVRRVWLTGERAGELDTLADGLPGYPDNISTGSDGLVWVTQFAPRVPMLDFVRRLPPVLRLVARKMPEALQPAPSRTVGVLGIDGSGKIVHDLSGEIAGFRSLTGVRERDGRLYFGSLHTHAIAITTL
ncbi:SMP-30/gluconolactonase/LRE family protein [Amycolatopsis nigrescens]|uniref:SMP-30/gluconolactonase/LRE family protein n=1 Tax=Amycolatopsis nigrescens TaxID=381445 RepID=UPI0003642D05|nr:SMP-30/gluconolactonase/LRE family protein [Amycolatopsis nigrescens]